MADARELFQQPWCSNDKTIIQLGYPKNIMIWQCLPDQLFA